MRSTGMRQMAAVSDLAASARFYRTVLRVWASSPAMRTPSWSSGRTGTSGRPTASTRGLGVGFRARDPTQVDAFWHAGIDAGYRDDGGPGPHAQYGPTHHGGVLLDAPGH